MNPEESTSQTPVCLDCGAELQGAFCSACGQKASSHDLSLKHVVEEVVHDVTHFDSRFFQTLRLLFFRPGHLTQEYLAGRRTRHVPPFRLYIFVSFLLFLVLGVVGKPEQGREGKEAAGAVVMEGKESKVIAPGVKVNINRDKPGATDSAKDRELEKNIRKAVEDPEAFKEHFLHWISRVMFVLLPAFATILLLVFMGSRRYFVEHVIFSLHFHSFAFSLFILQALLGRIPWSPLGTLAGWLTLALPVHLGVALKRVYGGATWKILLKGAVLTGIYLILVGVAMAGTAYWVLGHP
jgi:hypothetical protein